MNIRWAVNRMRVAGTAELSFRAARYLRSRLERYGLGAAMPSPVGAARGKPWVEPLPQRFSVELYRAAAERILHGEFCLFARSYALGFPPRWNRDPKSGKEAALTFGKTLDYRDAQQFGDIKYLWEPNRHLEMTTLAQAWRLTGETRFAEAVRVLLDAWLQQCPYPLGPNWTSSLEAGLRLVNWSCAWHLLGGDAAVLFREATRSGFKDRWLQAVRQHCHFIFGYLSEYSSANNHLLGELLGLLIAATTWPCWPESARWRTYAFERFEQQALMQTWPDGVNKEQAIWYQHEVADMMLLAGLAARANGAEFSQAFWQRLEAMLEFIASCMDAGGNVPAIGDSDDAVLVRWSPDPGFCAYRSLLASGGVLFNRSDFKYKAQMFDDKSRWLLGDAAADRFAAVATQVPAAPVRGSFAAGGYYILGSEFETAREVRVLVDAAPLGYLTIAAHGHADALALTLSVAGRPLLIDPGTYCYHTEKPWRDYFRGTSAHNTVRVDDVDQSLSGGNFLWLRHAKTRCLSFAVSENTQRIVAEHDGYRRLQDPVTHRRAIDYDAASMRLNVTDYLECSGNHRVEVFWHFAPDCTLSLEGTVATVDSAAARVRMRLPSNLRTQVVRGQTHPCLGWFSARYDEKIPSPTLVLSGEISGNWCATTEMQVEFPR
jgi:hypothetical protein